MSSAAVVIGALKVKQIMSNKTKFTFQAFNRQIIFDTDLP